MSFADSWYWASCARLLLTLHFSMFSFYPTPFILSLSCFLFLSLSFFLSLSLSLPPLSLSLLPRHTSSDALYQIFSSWSILLFHIISFHSSNKIHQLFTDYLLRLPSSELLEKHLFRSRANRRLVIYNFFNTQTLLRRVYTQALLYTDTFIHRKFTYTNFYSQKILRMNQSSRPPMPCCHIKNTILIYFNPIFEDRNSFCAKRLHQTRENRNFTAIFDDRTSFRTKRLRRTVKSQFYLSFR